MNRGKEKYLATIKNQNLPYHYCGTVTLVIMLLYFSILAKQPELLRRVEISKSLGRRRGVEGTRLYFILFDYFLTLEINT